MGEPRARPAPRILGRAEAFVAGLERALGPGADDAEADTPAPG